MSNAPQNGHLLPSTVSDDHHSYRYQNGRHESAEDDLGQPRSPTRRITPSVSQTRNSVSGGIDGIACVIPHSSEAQASCEKAEISSQNEKIRGLEDRIRRLEDQVKVSSERASNTTDRSSFVVEPIEPRLRITEDKVKIFPQSHWVHTAEKV